MKNQNLSKRIKDLRNLKEISQEELSEKSGLSLRTVQRIENGESVPRGETLKRLSDALDVSPEYFIGLDEKELIISNSKETKIRKTFKFPWYILGFTLFGCSLGFFIGFIIMIKEIFPKNIGDETVLILATLFGSLGIIIGNMIEKKYK